MSVRSQAPPEHSIAQNQNINPLEIDYGQVECVLVTKLQAAVSTLQQTNSSEITIHQCQVITACAEALLALRKLSAADTPTTQ